MPVGAKMVVVFKARVEHCVSLGLSHAIKFAFVVVPQTDVFHCSSPHSGWEEPAAERCAGSFISSLRRVFRGPSGQVVYSLPPGPCSGPGSKKSSRTSPGTLQAMAAFFAPSKAPSIL